MYWDWDLYLDYFGCIAGTALWMIGTIAIGTVIAAIADATILKLFK